MLRDGGGQDLPGGLAPEQAVLEGGEQHVEVAAAQHGRHLVGRGAADAEEAGQALLAGLVHDLQHGTGVVLFVGPPVEELGRFAVGLVDHQDIHVAAQALEAGRQGAAEEVLVLRLEGLGLVAELGGEDHRLGDALEGLADDGLAVEVAGGGVNVVDAQLQRAVNGGDALLALRSVVRDEEPAEGRVR